MRQDDLDRLKRHAAEGAGLAARLDAGDDVALAALVDDYRRAAEALSHASARQGGADDAPSDPQAVALAARLAEETGTEMTDELVLLAREEIDALDGDLEGAYRRLHARS